MIFLSQSPHTGITGVCHHYFQMWTLTDHCMAQQHGKRVLLHLLVIFTDKEFKGWEEERRVGMGWCPPRPRRLERWHTLLELTAQTFPSCFAYQYSFFSIPLHPQPLGCFHILAILNESAMSIKKKMRLHLLSLGGPWILESLFCQLTQISYLLGDI